MKGGEGKMEAERMRKEGKERGGGDSRAVLVAPVEDQEGVGLAEEILFVQLVPAELHHHRLLPRKRKTRS